MLPPYGSELNVGVKGSGAEEKRRHNVQGKGKYVHAEMKIGLSMNASSMTCSSDIVSVHWTVGKQ